MTVWILYDVFGISTTIGVVVIVAAITLCLIWLIFLLSKILLKSTFQNKIWENMFIFVVGFPTLVQIFCGSIMYLSYLQWSGDNFMQQESCHNYCFTSFENIFLPFLFLFMIAYLIQFMIRLISHKKQKAIEFVENE